MRFTYLFTVTICMLVLIHAAPARAQLNACQNKQPIQCDQTIWGDNGDSTGTGEPYITTYCGTEVCWAPETPYELILTQQTTLTVTVDPTGWDAVLAIIADSSVLECDPSVCYAFVNDHFNSQDETATVTLDPGTYYIVIDGVDIFDFDPFWLTVDCGGISGCTDDDGDGYDGYQASDCPEGTDCCDTGAEGSLGCTSANDSAINPGAEEICEDGIDNDCDGVDDVCPTCGLHALVNCGDSGSASTDDGDPFLNGYCATGMSVWAANEYLFGMVPAAEGAVEFNVSNLGAQRLDAFALEGVCDPAPCVDFSTGTGGSQRLVFYATAGTQYSFSVDGRDGAHGPFDYAVACRDESCLADDLLACSDNLTGDNAFGQPNVNAYPGLAHHLLAPEYVYTFSVPIDATVTATLHIDGPSPPDLALLVIEEDAAGNCKPGRLIASSDERQDPAANPPEVVTFNAAVGVTYFVLVDGWRTDSTGGYQLLADCIYDCPPGTTECFGVCVDLDTDVNHCGACGNVCSFPHAEALCVNGECVMGPCHDGWGDCNNDSTDGCETPLGTVNDCAGCDDLCHYDHADPLCVDGSCQMGPCHPGWADCNSDPQDGCETPLGTVSDCAGCGDLCHYDHAEPLCVDGACQMGSCHTGWADCNNDPTDGCETELGTVSDCAGCGDLCQYEHAQALCVDGSCQMGPCHPGWADCNSDPQDGCETELGTLTDCADCDDLCQVDHAEPLCVDGACQMGPCHPGWADCNSDPQDGCETELGTLTDCADCDDLCQYDHAQALCADGSCQMGPCHPGWADCNSDPQDGCETPLGTLTDCAGCDDLCQVDHAEPLCVDGACQMGPCHPGWADCNSDPQDGCETQLGTVTDCAGCGDQCLFANAEALCVDGECVMGACIPPFEDCNQDPQDGCEADLTSPQNCGSCGFACQEQEVCFAGKCVLQCPDGTVDCHGSCIDIHAGDINHCGGCDIVCQVANGTPGCESDQCLILSCDDGFADCQNGYPDGCETVLGTDQNCAGCGDVCQPYPNAYAMCDAGQCVLGTCLNGFADCNGDPQDGCETELGTGQDCAGCGDACRFDHAQGACLEGQCVMTGCHPGWTDCNQDPQDGCESDLNNDPDHCGQCGNACAADQICQGGECVDCADLDGDGHHDQSCGGDDCDESDPDIHGGAEEICDDGIDQNCDGRDLACDCHDRDGDGFQDESCGGSDCDDHNGFIHPDAFETCGDGIDQDCNGSDLPCHCDADGDGHLDTACGGSDCDDDNFSIHPGAPDDCGDGIDQDCDGADDPCGTNSCSCGARAPGSLGLLGLLSMMLALGRRRKG